MANFTITYEAAGTSQTPSPIVWGDCPVLEMIADPGVGDHIYDNFSHTNLENGDVYQGLGDNAPVYVVDSLEGRVSITSGGTDNNQSILGSMVDIGHISDTAAEEAELWFEARIKVSSIADQGLFVGLAAEADIAVDFLADNSAALVSTADCIGFHAVQTGVHTLVADTYVKLGFKFNPIADTSERIKFYVNGVETTTPVTGANIAAATFPDSVNLALMLTNKTGEGVTKSLVVDWYRFAQRKPRV